MTNEKNTELFDKIRADAVKRRQARLEQKQKSDEFLAKIKNEVNPLKEINQRINGELKK
jgi:hypothetical protein